jgi:hypothetical protein
VQLVTLLRDGQPVRMSKRRGEFVLMEELLEEVGRDAARFTFLTRRHDSQLDFDLAVATRQSADNPVFYVQYAHARVTSLFRTAAEQQVTVPPWDEVDFRPLTLPEEQTIIKRLLQYPSLVAGAARAREPHRVAYYLSELAGLYHPTTSPAGDHRGPRSHPARLAPCRRWGRWCATASISSRRCSGEHVMPARTATTRGRGDAAARRSGSRCDCRHHHHGLTFTLVSSWAGSGAGPRRSPRPWRAARARRCPASGAASPEPMSTRRRWTRSS